MNLKAGLTNFSDLQVVLNYARQTVDDGSSETTISGIGDTDIRLKLNLWGNDEGPNAFALMPFVTLPTHDDEFGTERDVGGGLIAPFAFDPGHGWSMAVMIEVDVARNAADDGYAWTFLQSVTASHAITGDLGGFLELVNIASNEVDADSEGYFDGGVTYGVNDDLQLDAGFNIGLTRASVDQRWFLGVSFRH